MRGSLENYLTELTRKILSIEYPGGALAGRITYNNDYNGGWQNHTDYNPAVDIWNWASERIAPHTVRYNYTPVAVKITGGEGAHADSGDSGQEISFDDMMRLE